MLFVYVYITTRILIFEPAVKGDILFQQLV